MASPSGTWSWSRVSSRNTVSPASTDAAEIYLSVSIADVKDRRWRLRLITLIEEAAVVGRTLRHLRLPTDLPVARPARAPPLLATAGKAQGVGGLV